MKKKVAIIGGGIIGLSTGTFLKTISPNMDITIISDQLSPNTTGDGAAGVWGPVYLSNTAKDDVIRWAGKTYEYLAALVQNPDSSKYAVYFQNLYEISYKEAVEIPYYHKLCYGFREMTQEEKSMFPGVKSGISYVTLMSEGRSIISYMMNKFLELGGRIIQKKVDSFDEVIDSGYDIIVNCTGLGARKLCQDEDVYPIRGHILKVKAPWIKFVVFTESCYIIPGKDWVVLGGTKDKDNYSTEPKETDRMRIMKECSQVFPSLKNAEWIAEWVGLRPGRTKVRLDKEIYQHKVSGSKYPIIHNYGHGGAGLTLFWGCAEDAARLIMDEYERAKL